MGKSPCEADKLPLTNRKSGPALVDGRVHSFWQRSHEIAEPDFIDGMFHGHAIDPERSQTHVRLDRSGKQEGILQHDAKMAAEVLQVESPDVNSIEENLASLDVVKTQQ